MPKHITLIGMMGSGKSTVAPLVGAALKRPVIEVDTLIEKYARMSTGEIFAAKGEAYFRRIESEVISHALPLAPSILSPGGGAFQWKATRELLLATTVVFYLAASHEVLAARLQSEATVRPLLNAPGVSLQDTIRDLLMLRRPHYEMAHYRIETDFHSPEDVAKSILMMREAYE